MIKEINDQYYIGIFLEYIQFNLWYKQDPVHQGYLLIQTTDRVPIQNYKLVLHQHERRTSRATIPASRSSNFQLNHQAKINHEVV